AIGEAHIHCQKLVLIASAGIRAVQHGRKSVLKMVAKTGKVVTKPLPKSVQDKLRARLYTTIGSDMLVAEHMQETFKNIVGDDVQSDAAHIHMPTLLIYGDKDTETPVRYGETLHKLLKNSSLTIIPGGEHFLHTQHTQMVSRDIIGFLQ